MDSSEEQCRALFEAEEFERRKKTIYPTVNDDPDFYKITLLVNILIKKYGDRKVGGALLDIFGTLKK